MNIQNFTSKLLESAVDEFAKLPGIGRKTALRLVLHLLNQDKEDVNKFGETIVKLRNEIKHCKSCNTISDTDICNICNNSSRNSSVICVVENARDLMSVENTQQFNGLYHVLGGIISPMDGIGPNDLKIDSLYQKIKEGKVNSCFKYYNGR
jgi:recombination protein RecR